MSDTSSSGLLSDFELSFERDLPELESNVPSIWLIRDLFRGNYHNLFFGFNSLGWSVDGNLTINDSASSDGILAFIVVDRNNYDQVSIKTLNQETIVVWKNNNGPLIVPSMDEVELEDGNLIVFRENMFRLEGLARFEINFEDF